MRYYRVLPTPAEEYVVQVRKWGFWFNLTIYDNRDQALDHLSSLINGVLYRLERYMSEQNKEPVPLGAGFALLFALIMERLARRIENARL